MYAKVFAQIFDSSIADDFQLRHFFMDLLVLADADGCVDMTPTAIAARTRIPLDDVRAMLVKLEQPDPESRTPEAAGRRIERLDEHRTWGWQIINYSRFRAIASNEQRKANQRERFNRWKSKVNGTANAPLTPTNASNAKQMQKQMHKHLSKEDGAVRRVPSKAEFWGFIEEHCGHLINLRPDLYEELVAANWCDGSGKRIAYWQPFVVRLFATINNNR